MACVCVAHNLSPLNRIERIDFLDERELLEQLLRHYCLSGAYLDSQKLGTCELLSCCAYTSIATRWDSNPRHSAL